MARTYLLDIKTQSEITSNEIASVKDLKNYLQIEGCAYDGPLEIFIIAARKKIENYCNTSLTAKTLHATFETHGICGMALPFPPFDSIIKVEWKKCPSTWQELQSDADYHIENDQAGEAVIHSSECGKHRITWTTKFPDDYQIYQQAILAQAGYMYTHRDDANGWAPEAKALLEGERNLSF